VNVYILAFPTSYISFRERDLSSVETDKEQFIDVYNTTE